MRIDILTLFPEMFDGPFQHSIIKRAVQKKLTEIVIHNIRDFSENKHNKVDDYPYGGEPGMVVMIQPIYKCISFLKSQRDYDEVIFMTPDGELFDQQIANGMSMHGNIILLCGHYKGIDERIREHLVTREISIGNFVLSGGELPAMVVVDALVRLLPGVLNDETSALSDSFQNGLVSPPVYTRPANFNGWEVPEVLLSGNDKLIDQWKDKKAVERTEKRRPDLI